MIKECLALSPTHEGKEGDRVTLDKSSDPNRYRLLGKVPQEPPYTGVVVHRGWQTMKLALPRFDVVFLRNVLIYFEPDTKREVLARVRQVMRPGGWLFLGAVETTLGLDETFQRTKVGRATAYRVPG